MTLLRIISLEKNKFDFLIPRSFLWEDRYNFLSKYKNKFGNANVSYSYQQYYKLGYWVANQRYLMRLKQNKH